MKFFKKHSVFIVILLIGIFLRFRTTPTLMTFTPDEEYQTYLALTIIKNFHVIWIGLSAGSFGLFLGPWWIYFISPLLAFTHGDPLILGFLGSLFGSASIVLLYLLGLKMFNKKVALIASLFYSVLPLIIFYDQKPYPTAVPFLSILMAISLYLTKKSKYFWLLFIACYGAVFNIHLSLLPIILVALYWAFTHKNTLNKKVIITSLVVFILTMSPLIMFDYFHKGSNISAPFLAITSPHASLTTIVPYHLKNLFSFLGRVWYLPPFKNSSDELLWPCTFTSPSTFSNGLPLLSILSVVILFIFLIKKGTHNKEEKKLLILLSLSFIIPFTVSTLSNPIEYYLLGFYPFLFLITAYLIESLSNKLKPIVYLCVIFISILGIYTTLTAKSDYGLSVKKQMIQKVMSYIGTNSYSLTEDGSCHHYEGWRYLFSVYARDPLQSSEDYLYGWLYSNDISDKKPEYNVLIVESRANKQINENYLKKIDVGGFSSYIYPER